MVVMGYWFCDITLSSYLNGGRYDLGFYAGQFMADWRQGLRACRTCPGTAPVPQPRYRRKSPERTGHGAIARE